MPTATTVAAFPAFRPETTVDSSRVRSDTRGVRNAWPIATGLRLIACLKRTLESAVVPSGCVFCGDRRDSGSAAVCDGCFGDLPWIEPQFELEPFTFAAAPLEYVFPADAAIRMFKFRRKLYYAPAFVHLMLEAFNRVPDDVDALLPVPLHWRRFAARGFNQSLEIARPLSRRAGIACIRNVVRFRATPYQSNLAAAHRRRNLKAAFAVRGELTARHVLIIDDVVTTGSTARAIAGRLLDAGVPRVSVLAIARVM